ncbi:MAG: PQQ-dependent dehydrogenase, methanol/ethanol family [Sneathiellaceae bacterium]
MKWTIAAAAMLCAAMPLAMSSVPASAQSADDLKMDQASTDSILTYGLGYDLKRFSSLDQVNRDNVANLVPVWSYSLAGNRGQETQPLVHNGVMFVTTNDSSAAIDVRTGKQKWKVVHQYPEQTNRVACCGIVNRGFAIKDGILYRTLLDANLLALNEETGEEVWRAQAIDFRDGYSMTVTPLVVDDVVITGISGGEFGVRGFIDGWDTKTGKHLWRRYTIPGPGEKGNETWSGDSWKHGGAPAWMTGSYDPELDLVYWGVGNGGPWNPFVRKGDNLYVGSMLALKPKTGEIAWHYQFSPNDPFDYDGVNDLVLADIEVGGTPRKVVMQANRNGFFYVLDRATGELLSAKPFVDKLTWADGVDMKTGRPIHSAVVKTMYEKGEGYEVNVWPSALGGKNWAPMSFSPKTGLAYINSLNIGWNYKAVQPDYRAGVFYFGAEFGWDWPKEAEPRGLLRAFNPVTGEKKWDFPSAIPMNGGVLSTAGDLVFSGAQTGELYALDAETGKELWKFQTGSGIIAPPVTYEIDGVQYVTVASGLGGVYALFSGDERLAAIPAGGAIYTFALFDKSRPTN